MVSIDDSSSGAVATATAPVPAPFAAPGASADGTVDGASATSATTGGAANKKKFMGGLGSYLPKVPSYLLQKNGGSSNSSSTTTTVTDEDPADELKELPDMADRRSNDSDTHHQQAAPAPQQQSAAAAAAAAFRRRGMSIEQNVSTLYRKMTIRQSSSNTSSTATDSSPSTSLTGSDANAPSPRSDPSLKARRGACVATTFGTGIVVDVRLADGFYIVELVAPKSIAYLRAEMIIREIKAIVGERVKTRWGLATVEQYYSDDDMYSIALDWRWDDDHVWRMKATTKKFEKLNVKGSLMQNTKNLLFEGYSTLRGSTTTGYANVVARLNTPATSKRSTPQQAVGKAVTPFGMCTVIDVRPDKFFVVALPCGATGYFHADSVKLVQRRTHFHVGDRVKTPYGLGEVVTYRDDDETYAVRLDVSSEGSTQAPVLFITDVHAETQLAFAPTGAAASTSNNSTNNNTRLSSILTLTRNSVFSAGATVYSAGATVKASATGGLTTVKASATGGLTTLSSVKANLSTLAAVKLTKPKFQKGERVVTKMGSGFVVDSRPVDKIYEVYLRRLKFTGYFHESALTAFPYERVTHFVVDGRTIPAPEIPRHVSDVKRRQVITAAIQSAREGKLFDVVPSENAAAAPAESSEESAPVVAAETDAAAPGVL